MTDDQYDADLSDCGWWDVSATDLYRRARLHGVPASQLLPSVAEGLLGLVHERPGSGAE